MNVTPETPRFRTDAGDADVYLVSDEGKLKFKLAQKALREVGDLSDKVMILREALQSLRADIIDTECNEETEIKKATPDKED